MRAMVFHGAGRPLVEAEIPDPTPGPGEVLIDVAACGVCRTDLHVVDGELADPRLPLVPGHQIVGRVAALGEGASGLAIGDRVGVPWLGGTCERCSFCHKDLENLCDAPVFTGYTRDGGYAERCVADARFVFPLPEAYGDVEAAPLLCAGLIGHRCMTLAGPVERVGLYGFGAAAHILAQIFVSQGVDVFAFTRIGDVQAQAFARSLGASWVGASEDLPPTPLDAAILFAPVGALVPTALRAVRKGGRVVCGGIHMSDIPSFPYHLLWEERSIQSVANLTREDGRRFFDLVSRVPVKLDTRPYPLARANEALDDLRAGRFSGAAVLVP